MDWVAISAVSDAIGALAVVITLIYLTVQVKQATVASRFAATATVHSNFNHASSVFASGDNETMMSHEAMTNLESLTPQEAFRFGAQLYQMYCHFDMVHHLNLEGTVDQHEYIRALLLFRWFHQTPGVQAWWNGNTYDERNIKTADLFTVEFKEFVAKFERSGELPLPSQYSNRQQ